MKAIISRRYDKDQTPGILCVFDKGEKLFECRTLELKWMGNIRNLSCIPEGSYKVKKIIRPDGRNGLWIQDVQGRTSILIHSGNYGAGDHVDIQGCILVGDSFKDLNNDGHLDIINSTKTFDKLFDILDPDFEIIII